MIRALSVLGVSQLFNVFLVQSWLSERAVWMVCFPKLRTAAGSFGRVKQTLGRPLFVWALARLL